MKRTALVIAFLLIAGTAGAEEKVDHRPLYTSQEYKAAIDMGATFGANVGFWCAAKYPLTSKFKSAEEYLERLKKCAEDKLNSFGYVYRRDLGY